ncbi:MAG: hypothetical protein J6D20_02975 [Clostridia bacterium]|nr:hypothetical protein [Clostridia bacterium]
MKTKIYKIVALITVIVMMLALSACNNDSDSAGEMTLVIAGDSIVKYEVDLDDVEITEGLVSVLKHLNEEEGLEYEISGTYLNKVGEVENNAANAAEGKYLYIYTSVAEDIDVSQFAETVEYEGKTLTSSGVGATEMHIDDGCVIYIGYLIWQQ